ncbi:hypothetical protein Taro_018133 [Colocasia esculenta]|uniref:Uncharacterized protein n=1 Tax=Colocasia esculenta TaxID=4460 RepID=A0A843UY72_COLES|nr:hypothetical protein [Colocasia esculenta]
MAKVIQEGASRGGREGGGARRRRRRRRRWFVGRIGWLDVKEELCGPSCVRSIGGGCSGEEAERRAERGGTE